MFQKWVNYRCSSCYDNSTLIALQVGDGTTLQKQILLILKSMEEKIVNEENEQKKLLTEVILELQTAISKKHSDGGDSEIIPTEDQLRSLKEKGLEISNLKKQLEVCKCSPL